MQRQFVALLAEGVDRNSASASSSHMSRLVALLAEGVDRNMQQLFAMQMQQVALLAEGVDRNVKAALVTGKGLCSRPPRGGRG